jgi:hypothetical protein
MSAHREGQPRHVARRRAGRRRAVLAALALVPALACGPERPPGSFAGAWSGSQAVSVRLRSPRAPRPALTDTVPIEFRIGDDGRLDGHVGGATLENGYALRSRGWFGRRLGIGSDYRLEARLQGAVFPGDPLPTKDVHASFSVFGDTLAGTLLQQSGMNAYPMVELRLVRR